MFKISYRGRRIYRRISIFLNTYVEVSTNNMTVFDHKVFKEVIISSWDKGRIPIQQYYCHYVKVLEHLQRKHHMTLQEESSCLLARSRALLETKLASIFNIDF